jgi:hypothetical protein
MFLFIDITQLFDKCQDIVNNLRKVELKRKILKTKFGIVSNLITVIKWHFLMVNLLLFLGDLIYFGSIYKFLANYKGS